MTDNSGIGEYYRLQKLIKADEGYAWGSMAMICATMFGLVGPPPDRISDRATALLIFIPALLLTVLVLL